MTNFRLLAMLMKSVDPTAEDEAMGHYKALADLREQIVPMLRRQVQ